MAQLPNKEEWPLYVAFLPVLLTLAAIVVTAAVRWHTHPLSNNESVTAAPAPDTADDYFEGLARLGIARAPSPEPPSAHRRQLITPVTQR